MIRMVPLIAALALFAPIEAGAQSNRAPITRGATSGDLAATVTDMRQRMAQMDLEQKRLGDEINRLNGEVETLRFLLSQSRDESERMQQDDQRIGQSIRELTEQNERMRRQISALQEDVSQNRVEIGDVEENAETPPRSEAGTSSDSEVREAGTGSNAQARAADTAQTATMGNPDYQGSLGTLRASDLPGEAGPLFAAAKSRLLKFDYAGAEEAFRAFLDQFSDDPQAGEAQYWLAETLFQQEAYGESGEAYLKMIREYPDDARAPDALVKLARSMRLVGDTDRACEALDVLPQQYPNASGVTRNLAALERTRAGCSA
ncbi:tol-pal system protein YbgF [Henriciella barbarensis]|uniref:Cell division coordinator CpoB n=1 Tax=Henriciella barbarensis TaxID=86342 RepID=A0A399R1Z0_9PROT|nr:tol-pal system protein YbgF [Henriciella barbarensis]RIJ24235.1 tol-pal system protein YbgF [Henriciella barbarensis]